MYTASFSADVLAEISARSRCRAALEDPLDNQPKGAGPERSGLRLTHGHIRADGQACSEALAEIVRLVNGALAASQPHISRFLKCRLLPQQKSNGSLSPIAIAETWQRWVSLCASVLLQQHRPSEVAGAAPA